MKTSAKDPCISSYHPPTFLCWPFRFRCEFTNTDIHCRPVYMQQKGLMPLELTQYHLQSNSFHNLVAFGSLVELANQGNTYAFTCRSRVHDFQRICAIFNFQYICVQLPIFLSATETATQLPSRTGVKKLSTRSCQCSEERQQSKPAATFRSQTPKLPNTPGVCRHSIHML